jgi:hypothetical protein
MIEDTTKFNVSVSGILEKFDGEGTDQNKLVERVHIVDGSVVKIEYFAGADNKIGEQEVND